MVATFDRLPAAGRLGVPRETRGHFLTSRFFCDLPKPLLVKNYKNIELKRTCVVVFEFTTKTYMYCTVPGHIVS